jgi:hypothetical protein
MRFPNEVTAIKEQGGITLRVANPDKPRTGHDEHISETQIDALPVDHVVMNDGTVQELSVKVLNLMGFEA